MRAKKILHVIDPDKFTLPFIGFINKEFDANRHFFLCIIKPEDIVLSQNKNVTYLHSPYRRNFFKNSLIFYKAIRNTSKIILHGNPVLFFFMLFPFVLQKTYWFIYGYEIANKKDHTNWSIKDMLQAKIKSFVLKRIYGHITHIKGDSEIANSLFNSSSKFFYSQGYLSNVVNPPDILKANAIKDSKIKKILVGNSTSLSNNHISIFNMLLPYKNKGIQIYCPLSYGIYIDYRDEVIRKGNDMFGNKFVPLTGFMKLDEYNAFLNEMDIAVFNHERQEAMGVTLSLLSMGKTVYLNKNTTSYTSLVERGFKVFDNLLIEREGLFIYRDVSENPDLVYKEYSYKSLINSWSLIFND